MVGLKRSASREHAEFATPCCMGCATADDERVSSASPCDVATLYGLHVGQKVLLVGDGNLSFARALSKMNTGANILATTYETAEEHALGFPGVLPPNC